MNDISYQIPTKCILDYSFTTGKNLLCTDHSNADTERKVKTVRKVEKRFYNFHEVKLAIGKRDRALQEIFNPEKHIALRDLPLDNLHK